MNIFGSIKEKITAYIDVQVKLVKLNLMSSTAKVLSYLMFSFICMFIVFVIISFMGLGIAETFITLGMARVGAYFATMGVFIVLLVLAVGLSKNITNSFAGVFIRLLTEQRDDDDDDDMETPKKK